MDGLTLRKERTRLSKNRLSWHKAAAGLLAVSGLWNVAQSARINHLEIARMETAGQLVQAEQARDRALDDLEKMVIQTERQTPAAAQAAVRGAADAYRYVGECVITSYCPCEECCGQWADGLTATGIPAVPGVVAVDPEVIPLGSVVVIDGLRYLAADTGVSGLSIDICAASHQEAADFGVQTAEVWIETEEGGAHGTVNR